MRGKLLKYLYFVQNCICWVKDGIVFSVLKDSYFKLLYDILKAFLHNQFMCWKKSWHLKCIISFNWRQTKYLFNIFNNYLAILLNISYWLANCFFLWVTQFSCGFLPHFLKITNFEQNAFWKSASQIYF